MPGIRKRYSAELKTKVALEAIKGIISILRGKTKGACGKSHVVLTELVS